MFDTPLHGCNPSAGMIGELRPSIQRLPVFPDSVAGWPVSANDRCPVKRGLGHSERRLSFRPGPGPHLAPLRGESKPQVCQSVQMLSCHAATSAPLTRPSEVCLRRPHAMENCPLNRAKIHNGLRSRSPARGRPANPPGTHGLPARTPVKLGSRVAQNTLTRRPDSEDDGEGILRGFSETIRNSPSLPPRLGSSLSPEAQYAMLKCYEDRLIKTLTEGIAGSRGLPRPQTPTALPGRTAPTREDLLGGEPLSHINTSLQIAVDLLDLVTAGGTKGHTTGSKSRQPQIPATKIAAVLRCWSRFWPTAFRM